MRFLRSLIGALIGSALGLGAYYFILKSVNKPMPWAVLVVGLLAGLGVRFICGKNRSGLTGIVSATTVLTALLGFNYLQIAMAQQDSSPLVADIVQFDVAGRPIESAEEEEEDEGATEEERKLADTSTAKLVEGAPIAVQDVFAKPDLAMVQTSPMDMIALVLTGLLAYVLGRGNPISGTTNADLPQEPTGEAIA